MKKVYVIIVNWNNPHDTQECLRSLSRITYPHVHIVLINNQPNSDDVIDFGMTGKIDVITQRSNLGYARSNNLGIQIALSQGADYILIINNDTVVTENFLEPLIAFLENNPKTIVSPAMYVHQGSKIDNLGIKVMPYLGVLHLIKSKKVLPDYLSGACFLCKAEYFKDIGNFDESFFLYYEDIDWFLRAKDLGYQFNIIEESQIWHKQSASSRVGKGWGPIKSYYMARNNFLFARKCLKGLRQLEWNICYLLFGSQLHLLLYCRSWQSLCKHYQGILDGFFMPSNNPSMASNAASIS